jgi:hypothetical protein
MGPTRVCQWHSLTLTDINITIQMQIFFTWNHILNLISLEDSVPQVGSV